MNDQHSDKTETQEESHGVKSTPAGGWVLRDPHSPTDDAFGEPPTIEPTPEVTVEVVEEMEVTTKEPQPTESTEKKEEDAVEESEGSGEEEDDSKEEMGEAEQVKSETPQEWQDRLRGCIKSDLEKLAKISSNIGLHSIEEEILRHRIPALLEGKFTVVLLGEFNHGKSTVVNALMGEDVLPTGITPTTSVITHLIEGGEETIGVKLRRSDEKEKVELNQLDKLIRETDDDSIEYVELQRQNPFLKDGLILVDTPGVNDISKQKVEITYGYLPRADVIIYVLDATQILKKSEIRFLKEKLLKAKHGHVIFVLGKIDSLSPEEAKEVENYARTKLSEIIENVQLHAFSARDDLEKQRAGDTPSAAFLRFKEDVLRLVEKNRTYIVFESSIHAAERYATQLTQNLSIRKSALTMQIDEVNDRIAAVQARYLHAQQAISDTTEFINTKINEIIATSVHNLHDFTKSFVNSLPREIETSTPADIQTHLPHFIQNAFKDWVEAEGRLLTNRLESLAMEVIEVTNQTMADTIRELRAELGLSSDVNLDVDTLVYDVSLFAIGATGFAAFFVNALVGGLLTLATPILAYYFRSKIGDKVKAKAKEEGVKAIYAASEAIEKQLRESISDYGGRLRLFVESAGDHLFKQISETLESVKEDLEMHKDTQVLSDDVDSKIEQVKGVMKRSEDMLKEIATTSLPA